MSVIVKDLVKRYGEQRAVDGISFEAGRGRVLGFLGPNGAGKSTTMKIITGFLPSTGGTAEVCGFDTVKNPLQARARIGYLPEHNPLYRDMYVREYLEFAGRVHKVGNLRARINEMIERTGLQSHRYKRISELSKGYRQRVGLAQAMLHNPEVLILDEPTSGLDPNQIVEIRELIRELGKEKTVIFSTHILAEVEAVCDRAIIINKGRLVADAPIALLKEQFTGQNRVTAEFDRPVSTADLKALPNVQQVQEIGAGRYQITASAQYDIRPAIFNFAVSQKRVLLELHREFFSVEEVFRQLTHN